MRNYPEITVAPPGPRAREIVARDAAHVSTSNGKQYPLVVARGLGAMIEDVDGNRYLDFMAGIAVVTAGHSHPRVVAAVKRAVESFQHICGSDFYFESFAELAGRLCRLAPGDAPRRVAFGNSGTEAVEAALKLARHHTGRPRFLAFTGAFHGRTMGALSLSASKAKHRRGFAPLLPDVTHVPYAYCYRCPYGLEHPSCDLHCVDVIEEQHFAHELPPEEVAAVFVEPILGEGGYVPPPPDYHRRLKALCEKYGILYVADEVQTGTGRTGRFFASEGYGVEPDIVTLAKGLASGLPIGATIARADLMTWPPGSHGSTFGGNPLACAAALATIELLEQGLMARAKDLGAVLLAGLRALQERHRLIGDVRGRGLMIGVELVRELETKEPAAQEAERVVRRSFEKGLLLLTCGESVVRFAPPLVIEREDVERALSILDEVLTEVEADGRRA